MLNRKPIKTKIALFSLLLLAPLVAEAQQPPFVRNDSNASVLNGVNGRQASAAVSDKGVQSVASFDASTGESLSVIPVSNAVDLNGIGSLGVGVQFTASDTVETGSTTTVINATSHVARVGDILSFRTGTAGNVGAWSSVASTTANTITLAIRISRSRW